MGDDLGEQIKSFRGKAALESVGVKVQLGPVNYAKADTEEDADVATIHDLLAKEREAWEEDKDIAVIHNALLKQSAAMQDHAAFEKEWRDMNRHTNKDVKEPKKEKLLAQEEQAETNQQEEEGAVDEKKGDSLEEEGEAENEIESWEEDEEQEEDATDEEATKK